MRLTIWSALKSVAQYLGFRNKLLIWIPRIESSEYPHAVLCAKTTMRFGSHQKRSRGQEGQLPPPPMMKSCCSRNPQICNNIDTLEGKIEIVSATVLFYLEKDISLYPKGHFLDIERVWSKNFPGGSAS